MSNTIASLPYKGQSIFYRGCIRRKRSARERKEKPRIINQRPGSSLLRKKCLNVIRVRVWPGPTTKLCGGRVEAIKRDGERKNKRAEGDRDRGRRKFFEKKSSLMDSLSRPCPTNDPISKSFPFVSLWSSVTNIRTHTVTRISPLLPHEDAPSKPSWTTEPT